MVQSLSTSLDTLLDNICGGDNMKKVIKCAADEKFVYVTEFDLTNPVNDYSAAREYLKQDDMTQYLIQYLERKNLDPDGIVSISWELEDEEFGVIELISNKPLSQELLSVISKWIRGQNSDGLGEGFEQQDFAWTPYDTEDEDYYYSNEGEMSSFDWETNTYKLREVQ
jgi:hypothetical protein